MDYVTLNNGVKMPQLGYGVYQTPTEETESCVLTAIKNGYRSIDTAQAYGNEEGVGQAIVKCGLPRSPVDGKSKVTVRASTATTVPSPNSLSVSLIQR